MSKKNYIKLGIIGLALIFALFGVQSVFKKQFHSKAFTAGPPAGFSGAPMENDCASCHSDFPVNSGTGNVLITGLPKNYKPGMQVPVTVTVNQEDAVIYGFQLTAIDRNGNRAGNFSLISEPPPPKIQIVDGFIGSPARRYVQHTSAGVIPTVFGTRSWTFNWTPPAQRIGKIRFYVAGNAANSDGDTTGDYIYTLEKATLSGSAISNFDGDIKSDIAVFRPSDGNWYSLNSSDGGFKAFNFGASGDIITPGDFDADGTDDYAVYRPSDGIWYIWQSTSGFTAYRFGAGTDIPVQGDYDGDGKTDVAVFRPSEGNWYLLQSTDGFRGVNFGATTDKPVPADFDADGKTDVAVYRPSNGTWYILRSSTGTFVGFAFGASGDKPVQGDYDGDGRADIAVYRPSSGTWFIQQSTGGFNAAAFGIAADIPVPADYDGDGLFDIAVYREGIWFYLQSSDGAFKGLQFGASGDVPVPNGYLAD